MTLGDTATLIGKKASVTVSGYTGVTAYELYDSDGDLMGDGKVDLTTTEVVMYTPGTQITVRFFNASGTLVDLKTVTPVIPQ